MFGFFNSLDVANLPAWKTAVGQDATSFEANPQYLDPTNATPNLHINSAVASAAEGTGADVGVTNDFDGETRASLTPVDIGADAGNFTSAGDVVAPVITHPPLGATASTANRVLTATITDNVGNASGATLPRIYFKKSTDGASASTQCSLTSGTALNGTYDCTIDYSLVGGGSVTTGNQIQYFVVAQDAAGNVTGNPSAGFTATSVNSITTPPTTPNSYTILGSISGSFNVGAGQTYVTLGAAVADLNAKVITGPVTFTLTDATYASETLPVTINANSGSSAANTVTIKPASGTTDDQRGVGIVIYLQAERSGLCDHRWIQRRRLPCRNVAEPDDYQYIDDQSDGHLGHEPWHGSGRDKRRNQKLHPLNRQQCGDIVWHLRRRRNR